MTETSEPTVCGCKGVRSCYLCKDSDRVKALRAEEFDFSTPEAFFYCGKCAQPFAISKGFHEASELFALAEKCTHEISEATSTLPLDSLLLVEDFVTPSEEDDLVFWIDGEKGTPWELSQSGRRKQDYGPKVNFKKKKVRLEKFAGMPDYGSALLTKMNNYALLRNYQPLEMCNLEYRPEWGSGIEFHIDDIWIWGRRLISLNLIAGSVMTLWHPELNALMYIPMPRRSLLCMSGGPIRYEWRHAVLREHISQRRIALTMREADDKFLPGGDLYETVGIEMMQKAEQVVLTH